MAKAFGSKRVLEGIDLSIAQGESLVLMGESGSGKSVLAKCVLGLLPIDDGQVYNNGVEISTRSEHALETALRRFGVLFQQGALFDSLSTWQNVAFGLIEGRGMEPVNARSIALGTMAKVGLGADVADLTPAELSGGMRKRVALARAIVTNPELLILDEPVEGLDPIMAAMVTEMVADTVRSLGATIFSITNSIACAEKLATRIAFLHDGKIVWQGRPTELNSCGDPYVTRFTRSYFENLSSEGGNDQK
ncbi:MAG TPA: ATP-binding cassette domain-containing protein [Verrucomicrobiae bacterium]|nr:ATP-binding cassette domain-containing protein [Verrucomicrobiae bacterium]